MNKKTKIILIVISSIILLIGVLLFLIFKTNLFLDTSDLVCKRLYENYGTFKSYENVTITFNKDATVKSTTLKIENVYENIEDAKEDYENIFYNEEDAIFDKENKTIYIIKQGEQESETKKETKTEIKIKYEGNAYECK